MKKIALLCLPIAAAVVMAGCGKKSADVAQINGEPITVQEFAQAASHMPQASTVLNTLLESKFYLARAKEQGVEPTNQQVDKLYSILSKTQDLDSQLKSSGMTSTDLRDQLKVMQARANLAEKAMKSKVTEKDVRKAYDDQKAISFELPERIQAGIVLAPSKQAAEKIAADVKSGKSLDEASKAVVARVVTYAVSKADRNWPPQVVKAVWETPMGKVSPATSIPPFSGKGDAQWFVVQPTKKLSAVTLSYDEVKDVLRGQLALGKASQDADYNKKIEEAKKKAKIAINYPALKDAEKDFRNPMAAFGGMPPVQ